MLMGNTGITDYTKAKELLLKEGSVKKAEDSWKNNKKSTE
jgi:hypothetical protein